jgi:hypothetical protein
MKYSYIGASFIIIGVVLLKFSFYKGTYIFPTILVMAGLIFLSVSALINRK